ncbi:hypothetical protein ABFX02_02G057700 [Erythranthe guttata]
MATTPVLRLVQWRGDNVVSANWASPKVAVGSHARLPRRKFDSGSSIRISNSDRPSKSSSAAAVVSSSPWLMLPPSFDGETENMTAYNFYSIAQDKLISIEKTRASSEEEDDAALVGSSHGWLCLFNRSTTYGGLFLSNPLTRRHIKLPSVNLYNNRGNNIGFHSNYSQWVTRVVISSSSPDDHDCRALMTFMAGANRLAFCCPGHTSAKWTPIGEKYQTLDDRFYGRSYEDFVYSPKQNLFYCVTTYGDFEAWDLRDPHSPSMTPVILSSDKNNYPRAARSEEEMNLKKSCVSKKFLLIDEKTDQLYHVRRFVRDTVVPYTFLYHNDAEDEIEYEDSNPYRTIGFDVHKIDLEKGELRYMDGGSLDGLAMFVGPNYSFALRASEYPELKPDSIYFTDVFNPPYWDNGIYGGHDLGIFDYGDRTISPCYYPIDEVSVRRIVPSPLWFTPTTTQL